MWFQLALILLGAVTAEREGSPNVCHTQELESKMVNTTYLEAVKVKKHYACFKIPPVCAEWVNTMQTRWKMENITKMVNKQVCCPGYKKKGQGKGKEKVCTPWCTEGCVNGECTKPETCTCRSGFSGERCQNSGCEGGRWGPNCAEECQCEHGGHCDPVTGDCECNPGYRGSMCESVCPSGRYGASCSSSCSCGTGHRCHPVTGDCIPCTTGTWGEHCTQKCRCDEEGTELCSHKDGRCFCKGNRFGLRCELHCPFGYINHTCLTSPLDSLCQCPNDLYTCDLTLGCVCPQGKDCGIEIIQNVVEVAPLSSGERSSASSATPVVISAVVIIALAVIIMIILYYRRRMRVMKSDLANRSEPSVYYSDPDRDRPGTDSLSSGESIIPPHPGGLLLNNVRVTLDSQSVRQAGGPAHHPPGAVPGLVKNINVDNFKLGLAPSVCLPPTVQTVQTVHLPPSGPTTASACREEMEQPLTEEQATDINLFLGESNQAKVGKVDLDKVIIRNNLKQDNLSKSEEGAACCSADLQKENTDPFADFESKLNVALPSRKNM